MTDKPGLPDGQEYFKLNEVCKLANVQPYMLRFWGSEFTELEASRTDTGQRLYTRDQVEVILEIRRLLFDEGLTIAGTRKRVNALREGGKGGGKRPAKTVDDAETSSHDEAAAADAPALLTEATLPLTEATAAPAAAETTDTSPPAVAAALPSSEASATTRRPTTKVAPTAEVDKMPSDRVQPLLAALREVRSEVSRIVAEIRQTADERP